MKASYSCNIFFIRHGESIANINNTVGVYSSPLSPLGKKQAIVLDENLSNINFSAIYSSRYKRAIETARIIAKNRGMKTEVDRKLDEWNIGRFDGQRQNIFVKSTKIYFTSDTGLESNNKFYLRLHSEMETPKEVVSRMKLFIKEKTLTYPGKSVLAVTHGTTLGFLLVYLGHLKLEQLPEFGKIIPNTYSIRILSDGKNIKLSTH